MARIAGVDLPRNKRVVIGLTYIFGIGRSTAEKICEEASINVNTRVNQLTEDEIRKIRTIIQNNYRVEGALKAEINMNIKRLMDINSVRGYRHHRGLPVHGQRTKTNARTRKGRKKIVGKKKK